MSNYAIAFWIVALHSFLSLKVITNNSVIERKIRLFFSLKFADSNIETI